MTPLRNDESRCLGVLENLGKRNAHRVVCSRRDLCARFHQIERDRADDPGPVPSTSYLCAPGHDAFISERFGREWI